MRDQQNEEAPKRVFAREDTVAQMYGIPVATLRTRRTRHPHSPPFHRVGRTILYHLAEVEEWIRSESAKAAGREG